jgi:hypothetical protein
MLQTHVQSDSARTVLSQMHEVQHVPDPVAPDLVHGLKRRRKEW